MPRRTRPSLSLPQATRVVTIGRLADRRGEVIAHHEVDVGLAQLVGELVGGAGAVGAHDAGRVGLPELLERQIEHPQMV